MLRRYRTDIVNHIVNRSTDYRSELFRQVELSNIASIEETGEKPPDPKINKRQFENWNRKRSAIAN